MRFVIPGPSQQKSVSITPAAVYESAGIQASSLLRFFNQEAQKLAF
jgi:hypothetical protein